MPTVSDYLAAQPDVLKSAQQGSTYVNSLYDQAAKLQAGNDFSGGNYQAAANTLADRGDLAGAEQVKNYGISQFQAQHEYIQRAIPIFQQIYQKASATGGVPAGTAALTNAFDTITPDLKTLGVPDDQIAKYRTALGSDPQGTLQALNAVAARKFSYQKVGTDGLGVFDDNTGQMIGYHQGNQFITAGPGQKVVQVGSDGGTPTGAPDAPVPAPQAAPAPAPAPVAAATAPVVPNLAPSNSDAPAPQPANFVQVPGAPPGQEPLGIRSNNPGNLQPGGHEATYKNPTAGILAAAQNLDSYAAQGVNTVAGIVAKWAPQYDASGKQINDTPAYIASVSKQLGVDPNAPLNLHDPNIKGGLLEAMFHQENGAAFPVANSSAPSAAPPAASSAPSAAAPAAAPPANTGARVVFDGGPVYRAPTADELKQYPGAIQINAATGEVKYPPLSAVGSGLTDDQLQPLVEIVKAGGTLPARAMSNPAVFSKILGLAQEQGVSPTGFLANQANRKATASTFQNVNTRLSLVQTQEQAFQNSLNLAYGLAQKAGAQGGGTLINGWRNYLKTGVVGDPATGAFINAVSTAMNEYGKIIEGSTGNAGSSISARDDANAMLSAADNLPAFVAKMQVLQQDAGYKIGALQDQHDTLQKTLNSIGSAAPAPGKVIDFNSLPK